VSGAESDPDSGTRFDVLIVGAGHAGVHVAATLAGSFEGSIGLLSAERREPYERPPLTKAFLVGDVTEHELLLKPSTYWQDSGVTLLLGRQVATVDAEDHLVVTSQGDRFSYGSLVWAAGADPLRIDLPGMKLPGVHELRSLDDTVRFREEAGHPGRCRRRGIHRARGSERVHQARGRRHGRGVALTPACQGNWSRGRRVPAAPAPRERRARGVGCVGHRDRRGR